MCKQISSGSFKNVIYKLFIYKSYIFYIYIYIYIYTFFKKKQRNWSHRIIHLFLSCYAFLKFPKTRKKLDLEYLYIYIYICTTTPDQSWIVNDDNEEVLYIPQSSKTGASPSDCLVSYTGHSWGVGGLSLFIEMQSVCSTSPVHWAGKPIKRNITQQKNYQLKQWKIYIGVGDLSLSIEMQSVYSTSPVDWAGKLDKRNITQQKNYQLKQWKIYIEVGVLAFL